MSGDIITVGQYRLDISTRNFTVGETTISLTPTEMNIVIHFLRHPNVYFLLSTVAEFIYGKGDRHFQEALRVHLFNVRLKITQSDPKIQFIDMHIQRGFMLKIPEIAASNEVIKTGVSTLDLHSGEYCDGARTAKLSKLQTTILETIMRSDSPISPEKLSEKVFYNSDEKAQNDLRVHIVTIRRKIEKDPKNPQRLRTKKREGYYFSGE